MITTTFPHITSVENGDKGAHVESDCGFLSLSLSLFIFFFFLDTSYNTMENPSYLVWKQYILHLYSSRSHLTIHASLCDDSALTPLSSPRIPLERQWEPSWTCQVATSAEELSQTHKASSWGCPSSSNHPLWINSFSGSHNQE